MISEELQVILDNHKKWLESYGKKGENADLSRANLSNANLSQADLSGANLSNANLSQADLRRADLSGADLSNANLSDADLRRADLSGADLSNADLRGVDLRGANLRRADLRGVDLRGANLDFSCFPLWCGGTAFTVDKKIVQQVLAHLCSLIVDEETKAELDKIRDFAKLSHRAKECGL